MLVIGIDPGQSTGVAMFKKGVLQELRTLTPGEVEKFLGEAGSCVVFFEDSMKTSNTFTAAKGKSAAAALKIARNVGEIDRLCKDIAAMCKRLGIECYGVAPVGKGAKRNAKDFAQITGWSGRSNQHARDAAMVAWPYRNKAGKA